MVTWTDEDFVSFLTFSIHVDPLKYKWDYFLWVDVSVSRDVLDRLQRGGGETQSAPTEKLWFTFWGKNRGLWNTNLTLFHRWSLRTHAGAGLFILSLSTFFQMGFLTGIHSTPFLQPGLANAARLADYHLSNFRLNPVSVFSEYRAVNCLIMMRHHTRSFSLIIMVLCVRQLVNSYREDSLQFLSVDLPVTVLIKQFEIPLEFLVDFSLQQQADSSNVFHKVDVPVLQTVAEQSR